MSAAQIANIVITNNQTLGIEELSIAQTARMLKEAGLSKEIRRTVIEQIAATTATKAQTTAIVGSAAATGSLKDTLVGLGTVIKAHPVIALFTALAVVIPLVAKAIDHFTKSTEELRAAYSETGSKVSEINSELETTRTRVEELEGVGPLSFTEQEELDRLKTQNDYLETQLYLLERKASIDAEAVNKSVEQDLSKQLGKTYATKNTTVGYDDGGNEIYVPERVSYGNTYQEQIDLLRSLNTEKQRFASMSKSEQEAHEDEILALEEKISATEKVVEATSNMYSQAASDMIVFDDTTQTRKNELMEMATAGAKAIQGVFWSSKSTEAFDNAFDSAKFRTTKDALLNLAKQGKVTAEVLSDPAYAEFVQALEAAGAIGGDTGVTLEELASHINSLGVQSEQAATELGSLSDKLSAIEKSRGVLDAVLKDIDDSGNLSLSTLQKILDVYPELESAVGLYSAEVLSSADVLNLIQKKYDDDLSNYGKLIVAKNQMNSSFFSGLLKSNAQWVKQFADKYGIDLSNYKTLAEAKLSIEKQLVSSLGKMWLNYYDAQSNALNADAVKASRDLGRAQARGDAWTPEQQEVANAIGTAQKYVRMLKDLENISVDFAVSGLDFSSGTSKSKSSVEAYTASIDELREALKRLSDVQDEIATKEAKLDLIDEDDIDAQEKMINELIGLYTKEQGELHNINNERDRLIENISGQLRQVGFEVSYDAETNDFWVKNKALLNSLGQGLETKERNELIKFYEDLIDKAEEYAQANIEGSLEWLKLEKTKLDLEKQLQEAGLDALKEEQEHLEGILDLTKDMIRQEKEDMIDAIQMQIEAYSRIIELKKRSLELTERERSYQDSVDSANSEIQKLQARIDLLSLDDSREAQAERGKLLEELSAKQKELADIQRDYSIENQQDALDQEEADFKDAKDAEIKEIQDFLNDNQRLTQAAMDRIDRQGAALFDDLLSYALRYTDTTEAELTKMWDSAMSSAQRYGSFVNALNGVRAEIDVTENGANAAESSKKQIVSEMKSNSSKWHGASPDEQARLDARNQYLGSQISGAYRDANGIWWLGDKKLFEVYHSGSASAGKTPTPAQDEMFALLKRGEQVVNEDQQKGMAALLAPYMRQVSLPNLSGAAASFMQRIQNISPAQSVKLPSLNVDASIVVNGAVDDQVLETIKKYPRQVAEQISRVLCLN